MNILAFDTCFDACSAALQTGAPPADRQQYFRFEPMQTGHAERLIPMIGELLAQACITLHDIDQIAVTTGPGTFTGTRICVAAARAFALAHDIPVIPLSPLALIARQAAVANPQTRDLLAAIDARHDEVYIQIFDSMGLDAQSGPQIMTVEDARGLAQRQQFAVCGPAAALLDPEMTSPLAAMHPNARYALDLLSRNQQPTRPIVPLYLRAPDAKPSLANVLQKK